MSGIWLELQDITFHYDLASAPVFEGLGVSFPRGWTGIIGENGAGKTTLLRIAAGELTPRRGRVLAPGEVVYCPQRTDEPPAGLREFLAADDAAARSLSGRLGIEADWKSRWATLSHGERKRAQIAVALWRDPHVLAADEPANHIDEETRDLLQGVLGRFRGVGLIVSHDRKLLDDLCLRTLFVEPPGATLRPGGYSKAMELVAAEEKVVRQQVRKSRKEAKRLRRETVRRREEADRLDAGLSKRKVSPKDRDAKRRIDLARLTGRDRAARDRVKRMEARADREDAKLRSMDGKGRRRLGISLRGERAGRAFLLRMAAGAIRLGPGRRLVYPELAITAEDRIGVTGRNGAGKSTLIRHLLDSLEVPAGRVVDLPQEVPAERGRRLVREVRALPRDRRGKVLTVISRLGSDPERVLETADPSPGEVRKILLALGLERSPWLMVMDEPTNHLDLPSIECMEAALAESECALLLVSHDRAFLDALVTKRWRITDGDSPEELRLAVG